jgi:hypothetical protein
LENNPSIRVFGDREDKEELYRRIKRDKTIRVKPILAEVIDPPLILNIVLGMIDLLILVHDFLKERKSKNIEVQISLGDGKTISIKSTNPDKLQVVIKELTKAKGSSGSHTHID